MRKTNTTARSTMHTLRHTPKRASRQRKEAWAKAIKPYRKNKPAIHARETYRFAP